MAEDAALGDAGRKERAPIPVLKMLGIAHKASPALQNEVTWSGLNNTLAEAA